jgi:hypothetical protein
MELDLRVRAGDRYKHTVLGEVVQLCEGVVNKGQFFFSWTAHAGCCLSCKVSFRQRPPDILFRYGEKVFLRIERVGGRLGLICLVVLGSGAYGLETSVLRTWSASQRLRVCQNFYAITFYASR